MWKTRFEVSTSPGYSSNRHRSCLSSSTLTRHCSRPSPRVSRVREDFPNTIVRPSSSSTPNLAILTEEDEDIPQSPLNNDEQPNLFSFIVSKPNSYQTMTKHQNILPTIVESHDHEIIIEELPVDNHVDLVDNEAETSLIQLKLDDSLVATNTNSHQTGRFNLQRKERTLNMKRNQEITGFTIDKRINELLQDRTSRQDRVRGILLVFAPENRQRQTILY